MSSLDEILEQHFNASIDDGTTSKLNLAKVDVVFEQAKQQIISAILDVKPDSEDSRKIDKGNENYYEHAEGFRLGWTLALAQWESNIKGSL